MGTLGDFPAGTGIHHVTHDKTHTDGPESCAGWIVQLGLLLGVHRRAVGWSKLVVRKDFLERGSEG